MPKNYKHQRGDQVNLSAADTEKLVTDFYTRFKEAQHEILLQLGLTSLPSCSPEKIAAVLSSNPKQAPFPGVTKQGICLIHPAGAGINVESLLASIPEAMHHTSNGKGVFFSLTKNMAQALNLVLQTFKKNNIAISSCKYSSAEVFNLPSINNVPRTLLFHKLTEGCSKGASGCSYELKIQDNGATQYINFIGVRENSDITLLALTILHEIGHAFGFDHLIPMGNSHDGCALEYLPHINSLINLVKRHKCVIDHTKTSTSSVMNCVSTLADRSKEFQPPAADLLAFQRRFMYLITGDKKYLYPSAILGSSQQINQPPKSHGELQLAPGQAGPIVNSALVLQESAFTNNITSIEPTKTGLRQRHTPRSLQPEQPVEQTIATQAMFKEILAETTDAFFISLTIGILSELSKYRPLTAIDQKTQETLIRFAVQSLYYGLPLTILSQSMAYTTEYLINYMSRKKPEYTEEFKSYLAPILPVIILIFKKCWDAGSLLPLIFAPASIVSGIAGSYIGRNFVAGCVAMLGPQPKLKTE